jgi:hypothetical protein
VYQGATATAGSLESEWSNAGFFALEDPAGNVTINQTGKPSGTISELVVFRTTAFKEEGCTKTAVCTVAAPATLTAAGSWSVTAK